MMEYVSLEERIMKECNDQAKEYLIKNGSNGLQLYVTIQQTKWLIFSKAGRRILH